MTIALADFLGRGIQELLQAEPFSGWHAVRSVETEPKPEVWYEFEGSGVEVICDGSDRIKSMFIHRGGAEGLVDVPFASSRQDVLARFGRPTKSGGPVRIHGLGDRGAWDRFSLANGTLHFQYGVERDEIDMITLMRSDVAP